MIGYYYICKQDGTTRIIDFHYDDPSDTNAVRTMHARFPPVCSLDLQVGSDEVVFVVKPSISGQNAPPTPQAIAAAFTAVPT